MELVAEIGMRMVAEAATVARLKSHRPGPKDCRLPIGKICGVWGKDPL